MAMTEKQKENDRRYRLRHPEKMTLKRRKRYLENREQQLADNKAYYPTYYAKNCERIKRERRNRLHAITQEQLDQLLSEQNNCCAICQRPFEDTPHIDHDHRCCNERWTCGKCNRGLLCKDCNLGLGRMKDDSTILSNAIQYLKKYERTNE